MKCPNCSLVTFDHLAQCPRCKASFARQRRLTRPRRRSDRPIVIPRPAAREGASEDAEAAAPPRPIAPPEPAKHRPVAAATSEAQETTLEGRDPSPGATRSPTANQQAADARALKDRMVRAGQVRRTRDQSVTAEVDPVLPDWYEPALDDDETERSAAETSSAER